MPVKTKEKSIEQLLTIAKPFVGSLKGKRASRPVLKSALVTENHIVVTDSHCLIRVEHKKDIKEPYLHHYKPEFSAGLQPKNYPDISRLIPYVHDAQLQPLINIDEWIEAHDLALVAAKEQGKNKVIRLQKDLLSVNFPTNTPNFNEIAFLHTLNNDTGIEEVSYNCEYMLMALKALKKLGHSEVIINFYGRLRPMYFVQSNVEILILPVRTN